MATFYLDFDGGNDANDGTSFANRWKSVTSGATAARIAPGDVIRVMASPAPTLLDSSASWTQDDRTVTLSGAVTATITSCDTAWTASANVTATANTTRKEGTNSANLAIASGFTTGLAAYFATGTLNLSSYQQVSFWFFNSAAVAASTLSLRLCTDTVGAVSVHTIAIPAVPSSNQWVPITVDLATNLNSAIASVALYADLDPGTVTVRFDNIIACKASSSADSLSLTSHIGKIHNLSWAASTAYSSGDKRKPTPANRTGLTYNVTTGGTSGSSEPTWPQEIGATVSDGSVVWTAFGPEETWYPIKSISGTTVTIDNHTNSLQGAGRGYSGATESIATYKRETIKFTMSATAGVSNQSVQDSGTVASPIVFTGGWNRTDMSTQTDETWVSGQNGFGRCLYINGKSFVTVENYHGTRANVGHYCDGIGITYNNCHAVANNTSGIFHTLANSVYGRGIHAYNNGTNGVQQGGQAYTRLKQVASSGNLSSGVLTLDTSTANLDWNGFWSYNNGAFGLENSTFCPIKIRYMMADRNALGQIANQDGDITLVSSLLGGTEIAAASSFRANRGNVIRSNKHDQTADNHKVFMQGGTISSDTSTRHTASGISWNFLMTSGRNNLYPMPLSVAKVKCSASTAVNLTIWTRRDATTITGKLVVEGGQIAGVPDDVSVTCTPTINTWVQSSTLTFTPSEAGVVEVKFYVWDDTGTSTNFWIDDFDRA